MKRFLLTIVIAFCIVSLSAQNGKLGTLTPEMLQSIKSTFENTTPNRALTNAASNNEIQSLALNRANMGKLDNYISNRVTTKGITDQKSSGRCWLYTGLNVIRVQVIDKYKMEGFEFSQTYPFFWDQLEKANLFLEGIILSADKPLDDKRVEWLLKNPIGDGGQWTGVVDLVEKYGLVPAEIMPDTKNSEATRWMSKMLNRKLRQQAMKIREMAAQGSSKKKLAQAKVEVLGDVYRILVLTLGQPPQNFEWRFKSTDGELSKLTSYTPQSFYKDFVKEDLSDYVMLMSDPSREYFKLYEIDYDRHTFEGENWKYINLPTNELKTFAKNSILSNEAMYFSCDVGKQLNKEEGTLDVNNYDYNDLFGVDFDMTKTDRIKTFESGSTHGMSLVGVDLAENENTSKWLLENSWGAKSGFNGFLIMTDEWFDEYMFRMVVKKKYISEKVLSILETEPILLPPWDPMFANEE